MSDVRLVGMLARVGVLAAVTLMLWRGTVLAKTASPSFGWISSGVTMEGGVDALAKGMDGSIWVASREGLWPSEPFGARSGVRAPVLSGEDEIVVGDHQGGCGVQSVEAMQLMADRELRRSLDEALIRRTRGTLLAPSWWRHGLRAQSDGADGLDEAGPAREPAVVGLAARDAYLANVHLPALNVYLGQS